MTEPILVLTTGGTIDKQYFDALSQYQVGETAVEKLLTIARVTRPYQIDEVMRKDSLDLTEDDRARIVSHVRARDLSGSIFRGDEVVKDRERGTFARVLARSSSGDSC